MLSTSLAFGQADFDTLALDTPWTKPLVKEELVGTVMELARREGMDGLVHSMLEAFDQCASGKVDACRRLAAIGQVVGEGRVELDRYECLDEVSKIALDPSIDARPGFPYLVEGLFPDAARHRWGEASWGSDLTWRLGDFARLGAPVEDSSDELLTLALWILARKGRQTGPPWEVEQRLSSFLGRASTLGMDVESLVPYLERVESTRRFNWSHRPKPIRSLRQPTEKEQQRHSEEGHRRAEDLRLAHLAEWSTPEAIADRVAAQEWFFDHGGPILAW